MADDTPKIPKSLRDTLKAGQVVPFIGAGVSMSVKKSPLEAKLDKDGKEKKDKDGNIVYKPLFPSWKGFVELLADEVKEEVSNEEANLIKALINIKKPKYLEALQHAQEQLGENLWYRLFNQSFDKKINEADEDSLKLNKLIWQLSNNLIITTNVDRVLQWTCPHPTEFRLLDVQNVEYAQLQNEKVLTRPTVWYLHGHIDHKEKVIFSREQFEAFYKEKNNQAKLQTLLNFLTQRTFLFIGFSLDDPYLREQLEYIHNIYNGAADSYYILLHQDQIVGADLPSYVKPISFSDFGKPLEDLIEELIRIANEDVDSKKKK